MKKKAIEKVIRGVPHIYIGIWIPKHLREKIDNEVRRHEGKYSLAIIIRDIFERFFDK